MSSFSVEADCVSIQDLFDLEASTREMNTPADYSAVSSLHYLITGSSKKTECVSEITWVRIRTKVHVMLKNTKDLEWEKKGPNKTKK